MVALTLGVDARWLDNLLSRHELPGVARSQRGVERRISDTGLLASEVVRILNLELGVALHSAVAIARDVIAHDTASDAVIRTHSGLTLVFPLHELASRLRDRLRDAVEFVGRSPRGRPRTRTAAPDD